MGIAKGSSCTTTVDAAASTSHPDFDKAHAVAERAEEKVNGNLRTNRKYHDTFTEKNGKVTTQMVVPQRPGGTVRVTKQ